MSSLAINTHAEAVAILSMFEGRIEVAENDHDEKSVATMEFALDWFQQALSFAPDMPCALAMHGLSPDVVAEIQATVENIEEQGDDWNVGGDGETDDIGDTVPFTAHIIS